MGAPKIVESKWHLCHVERPGDQPMNDVDEEQLGSVEVKSEMVSEALLVDAQSASACLSPIEQQIAELIEQKADKFDPVRFRFIEVMARRAKEQRETVTSLLEEKALKALVTYQADFNERKDIAQAIVNRVATQFPESQGAVQQLFEIGDFSGVTRMERVLLRSQPRKDRVSHLAALTQYVNGGEDLDEGVVTDSPDSFEDLVKQQERNVTQSVLEAGNVSGMEAIAENNEGAIPELKSVKAYRDTWAKRSNQRLINSAIQDEPEDAGPLNPQMLVARSLSEMRDVSPEYVNRYISYLETLLWLEDAGQSAAVSTTSKAVKAKPKKVGRKKSG